MFGNLDPHKERERERDKEKVKERYIRPFKEIFILNYASSGLQARLDQVLHGIVLNVSIWHQV